MSLPPLNPEKTAAGIVVDPRTLERVVPSSKRSDGTVRKELKIRPGFTPQEDVGRFRTTRQQASDMAKGVIPGSGRPARPRAPDPNNPFAQPVAVPAAAKSKAQLKNEKRREKKRAGATVVDKAWDESDDDDVDAGGDGMQEAFDEADRKHREETAAETEAGPPVASEEGFAGLDGGLKDAGGGAPEEGVGEAVMGGGANLEEKRSPGDEFIESPPPHTPDTAEAASPSVPAPPASTSASAKTKADPAWRTRAPGAAAGGATSQSGATAAAGKPSPVPTGSNGKASPRPHPIQGGRQGPIGLAHPPPASQPQSRNTTSKGKSQAGKGAATKPGAGPTGTGTNPGATKASEEPRTRKEVRVREGGANDLSSLAARVRNMVIANQTPPRERKARDAAPKAEGGA
ncbi:hypothetical protein JCM24511_07456 [Saitozyma sp. JCM 24511]|nr:hypothetical protein JCM24511_07456 [Saitozyma sp. JCM 24511]